MYKYICCTKLTSDHFSDPADLEVRRQHTWRREWRGVWRWQPGQWRRLHQWVAHPSSLTRYRDLSVRLCGTWLHTCMYHARAHFCLLAASCKRARCGDGIKHWYKEECDGHEFGSASCAAWRPGYVLRANDVTLPLLLYFGVNQCACASTSYWLVVVVVAVGRDVLYAPPDVACRIIAVRLAWATDDVTTLCHLSTSSSGSSNLHLTSQHISEPYY